MSDYKVNFREMKSRVGIDDIAYALGYRLDRKAGIGRYIELVLGEGGNKKGYADCQPSERQGGTDLLPP